MKEKGPQPPLGRVTNSFCIVCKIGRLKAVTRVASGSNGICGPAGRKWRQETIERLGCSSCGLSYEAVDRGRDPAELVQAQLKDFANPPTVPTACGGCQGGLEARGDGLDGKAAPYVHYLHCPDCLKVAYAYPPGVPCVRGEENV